MDDVEEVVGFQIDGPEHLFAALRADDDPRLDDGLAELVEEHPCRQRRDASPFADVVDVGQPLFGTDGFGIDQRDVREADQIGSGAGSLADEVGIDVFAREVALDLVGRDRISILVVYIAVDEFRAALSYMICGSRRDSV